MSTALMGYYAPADGADPGTWGSSLNSGFTGYVDVNFAGLSTLAITGATYTLSAAEARSQMLRITGTLLQNCTISPGGGVLWNGFRCVENLTTGAFTITLSNVGTVVIPQGRRGIVFIDTTNGPRIVSLVGTTNADPVPVGTKWAFYQASAPSGYTQDTSLNDYALRIVNSTGAGTGGSVNFSTLFARTSVDNYTLQITDIPSHSHTFATTPASGAATSAPYGTGTGGVAGTITTSAVGGGGAHTHAIDMRVKYADFILAART